MRIRERQLSEQLKVSRTPLREAIGILVSEKLVESLPNRGALVADDPDRVLELRQVLIETHAQLNARVYRIRYISNQRNEPWHQAVEEHDLIIDALEARDGALLESLLTNHLGPTWAKTRDIE